MPNNAPPKDESPADRFKRVAGRRTAKALEAMETLARTGGSSYHSSPEQRQKIVDALEAKLDDVVKGLNGERKAEAGFSL